MKRPGARRALRVVPGALREYRQLIAKGSPSNSAVRWLNSWVISLLVEQALFKNRIRDRPLLHRMKLPGRQD